MALDYRKATSQRQTTGHQEVLSLPSGEKPVCFPEQYALQIGC